MYVGSGGADVFYTVAGAVELSVVVGVVDCPALVSVVFVAYVP